LSTYREIEELIEKEIEELIEEELNIGSYHIVYCRENQRVDQSRFRDSQDNHTEEQTVLFLRPS
jgi:hypothetical protein